jgi:hypothetical protein
LIKREQLCAEFAARIDIFAIFYRLLLCGNRIPPIVLRNIPHGGVLGAMMSPSVAPLRVAPNKEGRMRRHPMRSAVETTNEEETTP